MTAWTFADVWEAIAAVQPDQPAVMPAVAQSRKKRAGPRADVQQCIIGREHEHIENRLLNVVRQLRVQAVRLDPRLEPCEIQVLRPRVAAGHQRRQWASSERR